MRRILLTIPLLAVALAAAMIVYAQDSGDVAAQNITDQLPITEDVRYVVGFGDTLDGIAALFDVSLDCLIETNDITEPAQLFPGDELLVRVACPAYIGAGFVAFPREVAGVGGGSDPQEAAAGGSVSPQPGDGVVVLEFGDTLDEIAQTFDVSVIALIEFNDIERVQDLMPGDVIEIPQGAVAYGQFPPEEGVSVEVGGGARGVVYFVQPADTLDTIGQEFDAAPVCLAQANGIFQPNRLQVRTSLFIPDDCPAYDGISSLPSGRIIPLDGEEDAAQVDVVVTVVTSTAPRTDAAATPIPAAGDPTPTPEVLEEPTESGSIIDTLEDLDVE